MKGRIYIFFLTVFLYTAMSASAQDTTPTATPTPLSSPQPVVNDVQLVAPENLKGVPAIAPSFRSDSRELPDLGRTGVDLTEQLSLTLHEAIVMALENNRDIEVSRKTYSIAEWDLKAARGFYQTRLSGQAFYDRSTTPNLSIFSNNETTTQGNFSGNALLNIPFKDYGSNLSFSLNNALVTTNNPISILSPQLNTSLGVTFTQPLLRGRKIDQPRRTIEIARRNIELTDVQFRQKSIDIVSGVQRAYWDLTYALRNLQVQRDSVRDAKEQLEHNKRLVVEGQLAPIDVIAAETQVANFEQAVYEALNVVNTAENVLKNLISPDRTNRIWSQAITPVEPVEAAVPDTTLPSAIAAAMDNRPELEINRVQKGINAVDQKFYKDQTKPQIDFVASYTGTGVGGGQNSRFSPTFPTACTVDPTSPACQLLQQHLDNLTGSPLGGLFSNRYPTFRVGVNFNLPLFGDKTAKAQYARSEVEGERIDVQREQIEQGIQVDVRNSIQSIRTAEARLRSAAVARENSAKQYESEQRKLDSGQSDVYRVLERQTALTAARSNELRARTELNKAIADLQRATGSTLKDNDVVAKIK